MKQLTIIDLSRDKSRENAYLSETLLTKMWECLDNWEKVILYLNKRGSFSSYICESCSYIYKCPHCDLSLNIHNNPERLMCHHCMYETWLDLECHNCHSLTLKKVGVGTEQIETSIKKLFPKKSIYRFDTDNLANVSAKKAALWTLKTTDIIIGTKMITTGFNIHKVWLIGVILLEQELNIPRYNTEEQVYSNMRQLLGRWGRVWQKTEIVLQTFVVNHHLVKSLSESNYKDFFLQTLSERKMFWYPPFCELAYIIYRHKEAKSSLEYMQTLYNVMQKDTTVQLQLVEKAIKRNNMYFSKIIIRWENIRSFLEPYRKEILRDGNLTISFENELEF